jgi:LysM repeat protein
MNRSHNQPNDDAEGYDLDQVLDDAFTSRRVPVLSPSMMDVRRRARRRTNRTRAGSLAAVACVGIGGVAVLANNHKPGSRPAAGAAAGNGDDACAPATTWAVAPMTTVASAGFLAAATSTTASDVVTTTTCAPQPPSGFRCVGDPTVTQDGWTYYDYCEAVGVAVPTTFEIMAPPTSPATTVPLVSVTEGDTLQSIAEQYCTAAEAIATYNGWPDGPDHVVQLGEVIVIPPSDYCASATSTLPTTELLATTTTITAPITVGP